MKSLYLIRHGEAENPTPGQSDFKRKLTSRGIIQVEATAEFLKSKTLRPEIFIFSPAERTMKTAKILYTTIPVPSDKIFIEKTIYNASKYELIEILETIEEEINCVALIGHNPGIQEMVEYLCNSNLKEFNPAGIAFMTLKIDSWINLGKGIANLEFYQNPRNY